MSINLNKFLVPQKIQKAINDIYALNKNNDLPFQSPIISGVSDSPSITCVPKKGASGRWCGSGFIDYFPSLTCKELEGGEEEEEGEEEDDEEEKKKKQEELENRTKQITIIEDRFRWGYTAE